MRNITITIRDIPIKVVYKRIRNLRLTISLRSRSVNVSSPYHVSLDTVYNFVETRYDWIAKHLENIPIVDKIEYKLGSTMPVFGSQRLIKSHQDLDSIKSEFMEYIKQQVKQNSQTLNVIVKGIKIKPLKSRWGSCNTLDKVITLNFYLVHSTHEIINYVLYHEMVHLLVTGHNQEFYSYIKSKFPNYKILDAQLKELQARL